MTSVAWLVCAETLTWVRLSPSGGAPGGRFGHTATALGSKVVVFKGDTGKKPTNEAYLLDTGTQSGGARCS